MADSFLGSGDTFLDILDADGTPTGFERGGNATKLEIQPDSELKEQTSKGIADYGQVIASVNLPKPSKLKLALNQLDKTVLAMAFQGVSEALNTGSGSITGETITAKEGKYIDLTCRNITAESVVVKNEAGDTTYVEGTDYEVQYRLGMIKTLAGGAITDGAVLKVDADFPAESGYKVRGAVQPTIRVAIRMDGLNMTNGKYGILTIHQAQIKPTTPVDFLADDFSAVELEGTMITPTGKTEPFTWEQFD